MAKINVESMERIEKERNRVHEEVRATYTAFIMDGKKYFQIDTYGRPYRDMPEKISQTIQLDKESAMLLIKLLQETF